MNWVVILAQKVGTPMRPPPDPHEEGTCTRMCLNILGSGCNEFGIAHGGSHYTDLIGKRVSLMRPPK